MKEAVNRDISIGVAKKGTNRTATQIQKEIDAVRRQRNFAKSAGVLDTKGKVLKAFLREKKKERAL